LKSSTLIEDLLAYRKGDDPLLSETMLSISDKAELKKICLLAQKVRAHQAECLPVLYYFTLYSYSKGHLGVLRRIISALYVQDTETARKLIEDLSISEIYQLGFVCEHIRVNTTKEYYSQFLSTLHRLIDARFQEFISSHSIKPHITPTEREASYARREQMYTLIRSIHESLCPQIIHSTPVPRAHYYEKTESDKKIAPRLDILQDTKTAPKTTLIQPTPLLSQEEKPHFQVQQPSEIQAQENVIELEQDSSKSKKSKLDRKDINTQEERTELKQEDEVIVEPVIVIQETPQHVPNKDSAIPSSQFLTLNNIDTMQHTLPIKNKEVEESPAIEDSKIEDTSPNLNRASLATLAAIPIAPPLPPVEKTTYTLPKIQKKEKRRVKTQNNIQENLMDYFKNSLNKKFARAIQREYSNNSDDWSFSSDTQKGLEAYKMTGKNVHDKKKIVRKSIPFSRQSSKVQCPAIPVQKIVEPLTNEKRANGCYIHSAIACTLPSIGLIPPSERSTCANSILDGSFDYEHFTKIHNYGTNFGTVTTPMLYITNNLYKDKESETREQPSNKLIRNSQFSLSHDNTSLMCTKLDEKTKQYLVEMVYLPETSSQYHTGFDSKLLQYIQEELNPNLVIVDFARSMESCSTCDDLLLKDILKNQHITDKDSQKLNLYSIVLFSPTMSHFITMLRDPSTNKWFLHTNALNDKMPKVVYGDTNPLDVVKAICKENNLKEDFVPCSCVYTSDFTEKRMNGIIS
ncbi:MAG: hypothetical protein K2M30_01035, partial [Desulfovibrionaceae bacterium]|nr:hypothetical protein [Desulfovibrionaceae bacterium]